MDIDLDLPGADLIKSGIKDLEHGSESIPALLVSIGYPRLRRLGLVLPPPITDAPEHRLYMLLAEDDPATAHSRYNAWLRRLISYERAAECVGLTTSASLHRFISEMGRRVHKPVRVYLTATYFLTSDKGYLELRAALAPAVVSA